MRLHVTSGVSSCASGYFQQLFVQQSRHTASSESFRSSDLIQGVNEGAAFSGHVFVDENVGILRMEGVGWSLAFPCLSTCDRQEFSPRTGRQHNSENSQPVHRQPNSSPNQRRAQRR